MKNENVLYFETKDWFPWNGGATFGAATGLTSPYTSLGFSYPYFGTTCTHVYVSMNGYIWFNNDGNLIIAALNGLTLTTGNYGTIGYKSSTVPSDLESVSEIIRAGFSTDSAFNFTATNAFAAVYSQVQLMYSFQIIILTDGYFSFFIMSFGVLNEYTSSRYAYYLNGSPISFSIPGSVSGSNCNITGTFIYVTNGISN